MICRRRRSRVQGSGGARPSRWAVRPPAGRVVCKVIVDRSDVAGAIELLGAGAGAGGVLARIARLADRAMGVDSRSALAWWHDGGVRVAWSPDGSLPDLRMAEATRTILRSGVIGPMTITDLGNPRLHGAGLPPMRGKPLDAARCRRALVST